jgi:RimJ/RimL family protein N-acetyltransferase
VDTGPYVLETERLLLREMSLDDLDFVAEMLADATEAAIASRDHAFERLGLRRVISLIRPENTPSQAVALRIGMQPERRSQHAGFEHIVFEAWAAERPAKGGPA